MKKYTLQVYGILKKHAIKRQQFILYAVIGISGVAIDYIAYILGVSYLGLGILTANFISISLGIVNNFFLNVRYNFKVTDRLAARFAMFYGVGFLGLVLSEILLVIFHSGLHIGPIIAKLLTLPIVLVFQYALNRYLSFGSIDDTMRLLQKIIFHWPGYIITLIFFGVALGFARNIPANFSTTTPASAPDEVTHYIFNVEFILHHHRLPVSGKDDTLAYKNCRNNENGKVPCLYSYTFYPEASYVVNAASSYALPKITSITPQIASRIPSVIYGTIFAACAYTSAYIISRRRYVAAALAGTVALIPQVIFTASYTNLDAHSLGISGLLGLALTYFLVNPRKKWALPSLAVTVAGLLPLAKYNYFFLALPVLAIVTYFFASKRITKQQAISFVIWCAGSFVVLASFWYIRNTLLYHDPLGQTFALKEMSKYHALGQAHPFNFSAIPYLNSLNFFDILFRSFFVAYGGMFYYLNEAYYLIPGIIGIIATLITINELAREKLRLKGLLYAAIGYAFVFIGAVVEVIYNSLQYDFQPQGRYLFPILMPTVLFVAYAAKVHKKLEIVATLLFAGTIFIFLYGMELAMKVYL